jgi:EAL domain-containing protein (putative c-di-GMP-specific phosphodiesterase class I)
MHLSQTSWAKALLLTATILTAAALPMVSFAQIPTSSAAGPDAALNCALASLGATFAPIIRTSDGTVFAQGVRVQTGERTLPDLAALLEAAERRKRLQATGHAARDFVASIIGLSEADHSFFVRIDLRELLDPMVCASSAPLSQCAERVVLELVNTGSMQSLSQVRDCVVQLRDLGFRIALDDLGAGYAALTSLATLEPEFIKLNRALVQHIHENQANQHIVASLVRLGHEMGSLTVADGVDKQEERDVLATLGCDLMQGEYFGARATVA